MMRAIDIVRKVAPRAHPNYLRAFEDGDDLLAEFGIASALRLSHFLAQVCHETMGLKSLREDMSYRAETISRIFGVGKHSAAVRPDEARMLASNPQGLAERVYGMGNPRKARELGNERPGDAYNARGGGPLQTTGLGNYRTMGERIGADLASNPDLIGRPEHCLKPALHAWRDGGCNELADTNNTRAITRAINGGYNGYEDRVEWFNKIWRVAKAGRGDTAAAVEPAWKEARPDADMEWLQNALNELGADPQINPDGRFGPATKAAVKWFQKLNSLPVDGIAGRVTIEAVRARLDRTRETEPSEAVPHAGTEEKIGGGTFSSGLAGEVIAQQAEKLEPLAGAAPTLRYIVSALMIIGALITLYGLYKRFGVPWLKSRQPRDV